jgi:regulator of protease activity HflC (stomatin/prohibitin superfamily)
MDIFSVLGQLLEVGMRFIPRPMIVRSTHKAVKFKWGRSKIINPGWRWWWPITTEMDTVVVVSQPLELAPQTLMTKDGQSVVVGGVALFRIEDVNAYSVENYDADESMGEVAGSAIRDAVVAKTLAELQESDGRRAINKTLMSLAKQELERYGVVVEYFKLTDLSTCRVQNIVGASVAIPIPDDE